MPRSYDDLELDILYEQDFGDTQGQVADMLIVSPMWRTSTSASASPSTT